MGVSNMRFVGSIVVLVFMLCAYRVQAQEPDSLYSSYMQEEAYYDEEESYEYEPSDEEKIVQDESDEARERVLYVEDLYNYVYYLLENDSLVYRYAKYKNQDEIVDFVGTSAELENLDRKFEVIDITEEEPLFYCREYVFNENKAWDFIYERLYDKNGKLIFFVRQYNTYNSGCAEVAFERSEYYWDDKGELIRKTYEIYDSHNTSLDIIDCWMEREVYDKIMDKESFLLAHPFPTTNDETIEEPAKE